MENGMIGLNPVEAKSRIEDFNGQASAIQREFVNKTSSFFFEMSKVWFSPKAMDFQADVVPLIDNLDKELVYFIESVVNDSCQAFNAIATSHGCPNIYVNSGPFTGSDYVRLLPNDEAGNVGMKIKEVKTRASEYLSSLNDIKNNLQTLPRNIAFYDREGALASSYATRIDKICNMVEDNTNIISEKLSSIVGEETARVETSAINASSSMS